MPASTKKKTPAKGQQAIGLANAQWLMSRPKTGWFHISTSDLGPTFKFTPRLPKGTMPDENGQDIEDTTTLRSSWAPSIAKAVKALEGFYDHRQAPGYVYHVESLPGDVDLPEEFNDCPSCPGNEYGMDFVQKKWKDFVEKTQGHRPSPKEFNKELEDCVPDAPQTGEHWATKPVTATRIGVLRNGFLQKESLRISVGELRRLIAEAIRDH